MPQTMFGVCCLNQEGKPYPPSVLDNPSLQLAARVGWSAIEPTAGTFDWSLLDTFAAQAAANGKRWSLSPMAGTRTPDWVLRQVTTFSYIDQNPKSPTYGQSFRLPDPCDSAYQRLWGAVIVSLGQRYASSPGLVLVKLTGVNGTTDETNEALPPGRTQDELTAAWEAIAGVWAQNFPGQQLADAVIPGTPLAQPTLQYGDVTFADRYVAEGNGLSATYADREIVQQAAQGVYTGWQALACITGDPHYRMNGGQPDSPANILQKTVANVGAGHYLELYLPDCTNRDLQPVIEQAAASME